MTSRLKKFGGSLVRQLLAPLIDRLDRQNAKFLTLSEEIFRTRSLLKKQSGQPIHVVFVCHNPSLWGKLKPVYTALSEDPVFNVSIVAVPYRHGTSGHNDFIDGGAFSFLESEGVSPIKGFDLTTQEWLDLKGLDPDYIFFQTPYDSQFPYSYTSEHVSLFAKICYVPYFGFLLYKGEVDEITHPRNFFRNISFAFMPHKAEQRDLMSKFPHELSEKRVVVVGAPMMDYTLNTVIPNGAAWNIGLGAGVKRVLWTPRWRTSERNCHFFDYKDYFFDLVEKREDIDFLFRPHPLCLQNFLATGEINQKQLDEMEARLSKTPNAGIDRSGEYQDTFLSSDILVSDMSSMLGEYFMTGKPIVYTHRVNCFNEFGAKLATGFYWVSDQKELNQILCMLLRGEDPLSEIRQSLIKDMFCNPPGGASEQIQSFLKSDFWKPTIQ